jgi:aspartyl-tRNA(Asn)/glutamyl-tRNA(Gln) amidotransferase subunit A
MHRLPTISEATRRLRSGDLEASNLVDHCLDRIREYDDRVNAWVRVDEDGASREAERLGGLLRAGEDLGPLHGIPIGIKDIIDVRGMPTEAGSSLLKGRHAEEDAPLVARLRAGGAIILGKTVTTEFAFIDPSPTHNPWNLNHTPGGSSAGSAAAVAMEMCMAAVGSQTGGSITRPASYCGVAGLKPTFGRVDTTGVVPVSHRLDHVGPMARTSRDLRIMLNAMTGEQPADQASVTAASPPSLHTIHEFFVEQADEAVRNATRAACDRLRQAGAALSPLGLPKSFGQAHMMHRLIMAVDAAEIHFQSFNQQPDAYGPHISGLIQEGLSTFAVDYALALRHHQRFQQDIRTMLQDDVVAITPATVTAAPLGLESTGDPQFNSPWSYGGVPTVTVPCGLIDDGLPCGLQLIGAVGGESHLLSVAQWCEGVLAFDARPPMLS